MHFKLSHTNIAHKYKHSTQIQTHGQCTVIHGSKMTLGHVISAVHHTIMCKATKRTLQHAIESF